MADGTRRTSTVIHRATLTVDEQIWGPAVIHQPDTTILMEPGDCGRVDAAGTLVIDIAAHHD